MSYISDFIKFASESDDIHLGMILGSYADNLAPRFDKHSDVDLFMVVEDTEKYLSSVSWLSFYNDDVVAHFRDPISLGVGEELRVAFASGLLSDIGIVSQEEFNALLGNNIFCDKILARGMQVIKGTCPSYPHNNSCQKPINYWDIQRKYDEFLIDVANIIKYLTRDDLFSAVYAYFRRIIKILIWGCENNTGAHISDDCYFNGRFMQKWLNKDDFTTMQECISDISLDGLIDTLLLSIDYFTKTCQQMLSSEETLSLSFTETINKMLNQEKCIRETTAIIHQYALGDNWETVERKARDLIREALDNHLPISFVMPSFPGKSPNSNSTFSFHAGIEEYISLETINTFCQSIREVYPYGCEFNIIHDGTIFFDLGITRTYSELCEYMNEVRNMAQHYTGIRCHSLPELLHKNGQEESQLFFIQHYYTDLPENITPKLLQNEILFTLHEFNDVVNEGISKNRSQTKAKTIAKEVLHRKTALSKMISDFFPQAIRLSVHFQHTGSTKIGFKLIPGAINLGTPWFNILYIGDTSEIFLGKRNYPIPTKELCYKSGYPYFAVHTDDLDATVKQTINLKKGCYYVR